MNTTEQPSTSTQASSPRKGRGIDAEALLASLAPVVAKPEDASPRAAAIATKSAEPTKKAAKKKSAEPASQAVQKQISEPAEPARNDDDEADEIEQIAEAKPARKPKAKSSSRSTGDRQRAKLDVEINPGEGTTAIYVRVPRTTHLALKIQALENQAAMEGPTELASIVRAAIGEYLERQAKRKAA